MTEDWLKTCVLVGVCAFVVLGMWFQLSITRGYDDRLDIDEIPDPDAGFPDRSGPSHLHP